LSKNPGEVLEPLEDPGPHGGQKTLPDRADLIDLSPRGYGPNDVDPEEHQHYPGEPGQVAGYDVAVYGASYQPGPSSLSHRPEHDEPEYEHQLARIGTQLSQEAPGGGAPVAGALLRHACDGFNAPDLSSSDGSI
jgi:hypothetical protein